MSDHAGVHFMYPFARKCSTSRCSISDVNERRSFFAASSPNSFSSGTNRRVTITALGFERSICFGLWLIPELPACNMIYISVYHVGGQRKEDPMTDQQRLTEALDRFDMVQAADILELVSQTKDGLFTGSELLTKLERTLGTTFGTDADLGITEGITELPGIQSVLATRSR